MKTSRTVRRVPRARRTLRAAVGILTATVLASACATAAATGGCAPPDADT